MFVYEMEDFFDTENDFTENDSIAELPPESSPVISELEANKTEYVAGVCAKKFKTIHGPCLCTDYIAEHEKDFTNTSQLFTYYKSYSKLGDDLGALQVPTAEFSEFINLLNNHFDANFDAIVNRPGICAAIKKDFDVGKNWPRFQRDSQCFCDFMKVVDYFKRTRVFFICKTLNQLIVTQPKNKENRKYRKINNL